MSEKIPFEDRFWPKVEKTDTCWVWRGSHVPDGYGNIRGEAGKNVQAHRAAYELLVGEIPEGLTIDHLCRRRDCVNPDHMEVVPWLVNIGRGVFANSLKTHCPRGHEYTAENTRICRKGKRSCKTCARLVHYPRQLAARRAAREARRVRVG